MEECVFVVDPLNEVSAETSASGSLQGVMRILSNGKRFRIQWNEKALDGSNIDADVKWDFGKPFSADVSEFSKLILSEGPSFGLFRNGHTSPRQFQATDLPFWDFVLFLHWLAVNGVVVPSSSTPYQLEFYKNARPGTYSYVPPWVVLDVCEFQGLAPLWCAILDMYEKLALSLDEVDLIPKDSQFPMAELARTSHNYRMNIIKSKYLTTAKYEVISESDWDNLFDEFGRIKDVDLFRSRLYFAGIDRSLLDKAIMFVVGVYPWDSTQSERNALDRSLAHEFDMLDTQLQNTTKKQIENNKRRFSAFRVIDHDVYRTDRGEMAFKNVNGVGLQIVSKILKCYTIFNPPIGYLQGMNDLVVPIVFAFFPSWNGLSEPVDDKGNVIEGWSDQIWKVFWSFESLLRNVNHLRLLANVTEQTKAQSKKVGMILRKLSPMVHVFMKRSGLMELHWCYSDFILLFKRTFSDVWPVWLQLNCSCRPHEWLSFFIAAVFLVCFEPMTKLPENTVTSVMEAFPSMVKNSDLDLVARLALWIAQEMTSDKDYQEFSGMDLLQRDLREEIFEFFQCDLTNA